MMPSGWVAAASSTGGNCFLSREWELLNSVLQPAAARQAGIVCVGSWDFILDATCWHIPAPFPARPSEPPLTSAPGTSAQDTPLP